MHQSPLVGPSAAHKRGWGGGHSWLVIGPCGKGDYGHSNSISESLLESQWNSDERPCRPGQWELGFVLCLCLWCVGFVFVFVLCLCCVCVVFVVSFLTCSHLCWACNDGGCLFFIFFLLSAEVFSFPDLKAGKWLHTITLPPPCLTAVLRFFSACLSSDDLGRSLSRRFWSELCSCCVFLLELSRIHKTDKKNHLIRFLLLSLN